MPVLPLAARVHNVEKVLEMLRKNPKMPLRYLHSAQTIAEGQGSACMRVVRGLLAHLKKAYPSS